jgi:serine/threonine protein kinase/Tfp pilus assembly protein PilF
MTAACPPAESLHGLLDERLHGRELEEVVLHIEICSDCQEQLEHLTNPDRWKVNGGAFTSARNRDEDVSTRLHVPSDAGAVVAPDGVASSHEGVEQRSVPSGSTRLSILDVFASDPYRTATQSRLENGGLPLESGGPPADWPNIPGYQITQRLGEGGMGVVYEARQIGLKRRVALKMIRGGAAARPELVNRFRIEAEAVARLRHPNIMQIFDIGEVHGLPFVSFELLEGGRLADRLSGTPLPGHPAAELVATLALAIEAAHQAGIVHRDLKPTNVLFAADGTPKITDFGLAKRIDSDDGQTETGQILGSPSYMAPEQARGHVRGIGPAADVYALGAILYEMITGRPPFKGETRIETLRQVIADDPVAPSRLAPLVARDLETICLKCLNKESTKRYPSARALADDLGRYCNGESIKARPTPFWERGFKWARRHPLWAAASILFVAASYGLIVSRFNHELKLFDRQTAGLNLLQRVELAQASDQLEAAQAELSEFLPTIKDEKRLQSLAVRIADKRKDIRDRLGALQTAQANENRRRAARDDYDKFRMLRNEAQLYAARLMVLDPAEHQKALRGKVLAAVSIYGQNALAAASAWSLVQPLPDALDLAERSEVKAGCHDLLLILAEAEGKAEGLKILDRAAGLSGGKLTKGYHLLRAACLATISDVAGQAREEELAAKVEPVSAFDYLLLARRQFASAQHVGRGQLAPGEVIQSCQTAIRLDPNQLGAHLLLAVVYFNSQRFSEARASLNTCINRAPGLLGLYLFRALVSGEEGAKALLRIKETPARAAEWKVDAAEAFEAAEHDYRRALELGPSPDLRYVLLVDRGGMYLRESQLDQAVVDVEAAVELNPKPYHAHALLAQVRERQGRSQEAAAALARAVERKPDKPELYRARAMLRVRAHDEGSTSQNITPALRALAIRDLEHCINLEPRNSRQTADDYAELGRLLLASGKSAEALAAYDAALRIVPDDLKALRLRAVALLAEEKYDDVLAACTAYLKQGTPSADLLEIRGHARLARKELDGAASDYTIALSLRPGSATLHNHRGWAYLFADAFKPALADFDAAIQLDPKLSHAYSGRALSRVSLGRWRDALDDVRTAIELASGAQKQQVYFNAARVNALSMKFVAEVSRRGEADVALYRRLRDRAAALLKESVGHLPPEHQDRFWREVVASDPVMRQFQPGPSELGQRGVGSGNQPSAKRLAD